MVKVVIGEESHLKSAEDRLLKSSILAEVGIIVGKLSTNSEKGFVYSVIPTPSTDAGNPACSLKAEAEGRGDRKKGAKGGKSLAEANPSLLIDGEWVAEHARQVSRMLLGGMSVVGIYVWSSEAAFKATSTLVFSQVIRGVAQALPAFESKINERLLVHISYSPRRWACRNFSVASADMRPCDFKMSKILNLLQMYRCIYNFDLRVPVFQDDVSTSRTFKNVLRTTIACHAKELQSARALVDGKLANEDQQVTFEGSHTVELLLPFKTDAYVEAYSSEEILGVVVLRGAICASSYLGPKEPFLQALSDLKKDVINSLESRLEIVLDESDDKLDEALADAIDAGDRKPLHQHALKEVRKSLALSFPRRVLIPWLSGTFICDYLLHSETFEDLSDRCREMMSMEAPVDPSALQEVEAEAAILTTASFWEAICGNSLPSREEPKSRNPATEENSPGKQKPFNFNLQAALFMLLVALLVGFAFTFFKSN
ncbi:hypothetical protein HPP92_028142 [Vanilla planifolia]|uniref:Protein odr-4 homolog n=1 Tax=Vanilla planifolia TaxID=51239 RepID=A0A835U6G4_VANPL|nr:hypothetical protein HPP92_028142 [Vanilla planifolia]KAG0447896.1 hypothetical protein HPP92_028121 [Vanilla planifolia]